MGALISVLMPAYNHGKYVETAVRSVLGQDWPRIELIVIDDGSSDGTWDILQRLRPECERHLERVVMIRQENQGTCVTMNRLLQHVCGDFVGLLASDDAYLPGAFRRLMEPMMCDDATGVVVGCNELMDGNGRRCYWDDRLELVHDQESAKYIFFNDFIRSYSGVDDQGPDFGSYRALLKVNHVANGAMIRKSALDCVPPFRKDAPLEDWWLHLQLSKVTRYAAIREPTFRYRWHGGNSISRCGKMEDFAERTLRFEERRIFAQRDLRRIRDCLEMRSSFGIPWLFAFRRYRTWFAKVWSLTAFGFERFFRRESAGRVITGLGAWGK